MGLRLMFPLNLVLFMSQVSSKALIYLPLPIK